MDRITLLYLLENEKKKKRKNKWTLFHENISLAIQGFQFMDVKREIPPIYQKTNIVPMQMCHHVTIKGVKHRSSAYFYIPIYFGMFYYENIFMLFF